jgi:hypothetical protein
MFHAITRIGMVCALTLGVVATANAQSAQANTNAQQKQDKRHPKNQVPDRGLDDPADQAAAVDDAQGPDVTAVQVRVHPSGMRSAQLPEDFMEAITVTRRTDGTLEYGHYTGMAAAERAVRLLPSRPLPQLFPVLEEKE